MNTLSGSSAYLPPQVPRSLVKPQRFGLRHACLQSHYGQSGGAGMSLQDFQQAPTDPLAAQFGVDNHPLQFAVSPVIDESAAADQPIAQERAEQNRIPLLK